MFKPTVTTWQQNIDLWTWLKLSCTAGSLRLNNDLLQGTPYHSRKAIFYNIPSSFSII